MKSECAKSKLEYRKTVLPGVEIKRCNHTHHSYKHHVHKELSLGYIVEGSSVVEFGGENYEYSAGDGVVIPAMLSHMCSPRDPEHWHVVMLYIDLFYYGESLAFSRAAKITKSSLERLKELVERLEMGENAETLDGMLTEILLEVEKTTQKHVSEIKGENPVIQRIFDYILSNFKKNISLSHLEKKFEMNKFTIIRGFKSAYNTTPAAFGLQVKVTEAKKMLANGNSVFDACEELNFYDQAHFIREFKNMTGITPYAYMKNTAAK